MTAKRRPIKQSWIDPDDAPELTPELARRAQVSVGGKIVRQATGTVTKRGRPPVGDEPKQQVTLRLDPKVIRYFKQDGEGWQTRLNEVLQNYVAGVKPKTFPLGGLIRSAVKDAFGKKDGPSANRIVRSSLTGKLATNVPKARPTKKRA